VHTRTMNTTSTIIACFVITACGTGSGTGASGSSGTSGGSSATPDRTVTKGSETAPDTKGAPSTPAPTGKSCGSADDCAYFYCQCSDGAIVNSRLCSQNACQGAAAHCGTACAVFRHGAWTGVFGGGDTATPPSTKPDGGTPTGACTTNDQCAAFQCGCTNGSRITVRDCLGNQCQSAETGCQSACSDSGRGDWDGT
jgi:hypothetical protein